MSFSNFVAKKSQKQSVSSRPVSDKQYKFYTDMCGRKGIKVQDQRAFSPKSLSEEIDRIMQLDEIASPKQVERIMQLVEEINEIGGAFNKETMKQEHISLTEKQASELSGGRDGQASQLIGWLFERKSELSSIAPPSDAQLDIVQNWMLCPDIPFEAFDINKKVYLDEYIGEVQAWRLMTLTEFRNEIKGKMVKADASKFIDTYAPYYYQWRQTRINDNQKRMIRTIEERLSVIEPQSSGQQITFKDGEIVAEETTKRESRTRTETRNGYTPLTDEQLDMLSYDDAREWIERLKYEQKLMRNVQTMNGEEKVYDEQQYDRNAMSEIDAENKEFDDLNNLTYAVEAILGYADDEAHDHVKHILVDGSDTDSVKESKQYLNNFFLATVTADEHKNEQQWNKEIARIYNMCQEVPIALEILEMDSEQEQTA